MQRTYPLLITVGLLLLIATVLALVYMVPAEFGRRPWDNFDLLLVPRDQSIGEMLDVLRNAGEAPLDRYSATIEIEDFAGRAGVPVEEIPSRFDADDPRLDPFVRSVPGLFRAHSSGDEVEVFYLPRDEDSGTLPRRYRELRDILSGYRFRLAGWSPVATIVSGITAAIVMAFAAAGVPRRRGPVFAAVALTALYATVGHPSGLIRGAMIGLAWAIWQENAAAHEREWFAYGSSPFASVEYRLYLATLTLVSVVSAVTLIFEPAPIRQRMIIAFGLYLTALVAISGLAFLFSIRRMKNAEHRLFLPVPIRPRPVSYRVLLSTLLSAWVFVVIAQLALGAWYHDDRRPGRSDSVELPVPIEISDSGTGGYSSPEERILTLSRRVAPEEEPLSTSGYLAHRKFQESLVYGGAFRLPDLDETVELVRFVREEGRIRNFSEAVLTFDREWVSRQMRPAPGTVYQLIVNEGGVVTVRLKSLPPDVLPRRRVFLLFFPILIGFLPLVYGLRLPYRSRIDTVAFASRRA